VFIKLVPHIVNSFRCVSPATHRRVELSCDSDHHAHHPRQHRRYHNRPDRSGMKQERQKIPAPNPFRLFRTVLTCQ